MAEWVSLPRKYLISTCLFVRWTLTQVRSFFALKLYPIVEYCNLEYLFGFGKNNVRSVKIMEVIFPDKLGDKSPLTPNAKIESK